MRLKFIIGILWKGIDIGFAIKYGYFASFVSNHFIQCGYDTLLLANVGIHFVFIYPYILLGLSIWGKHFSLYFWIMSFWGRNDPFQACVITLLSFLDNVKRGRNRRISMREMCVCAKHVIV